MIFAEQRLLSICADRLGIKPKTLLEYENLPETNGLITHTWNAKPFLRMEKELSGFFIDRCKELCRTLEQELGL